MTQRLVFSFQNRTRHIAILDNSERITFGQYLELKRKKSRKQLTHSGITVQRKGMILCLKGCLSDLSS